MRGKCTLNVMIRAMLIALALPVIFLGCSGLSSQNRSSGSDASQAQSIEKKTTVYYDFGDVLLPNQLKIDNSNSFVLSASGLTAGVLSLKGRVEINSLITFFENKMPIDGWTLVNKFRGLRNMLLFTKQNRNCVITIDEGQINTLVEIWVAPTIQGPVSGLHK